MKKMCLIGGLIASFFTMANSYAAQSPEQVKQNPNVIGGKDAGNYPFMANLAGRNPSNNKISVGCGGAFISKRIVLTAAHCAIRNTFKMGVVHNVRTSDDINKALLIKVDSIAIYSNNLEINKYTDDVALLFLEDYDETKLAQPIVPIPMNTDVDSLEAGRLVTVLGWGNTTSAGYKPALKLQELEMPIIDHKYCKETLKQNIKDSELCAGFVDGTKDSCQGDSGGPLFSKENGSYSLVGIVSRGNGCAQKGHPGIYGSVAHVKDWIDKQVALFTQKETKPEAENLSSLILGSCYEKFGGPIFKDTKLVNEKIISLEKSGIELLPTKAETIDGHKKHGEFCNFKSANDSKITVNTNISEDLKEVSFGIKVDDGKEVTTYSSKIKSKSNLNLICGVGSFAMYESDNALIPVIIISPEETYAGYQDKSKPSLKSLPKEIKKLSECKLDDANSFSFYQSTTDKEKFFVQVLASNLDNPSEEKFYSLTQEPPFPEPQPFFSISLKKENDTTGKITIHNDMLYKNQHVHTWEIQCNFDFTLKDSDGNSYEATTHPLSVTNKFVDFIVNKSKWGTIDPNGSLTFDYELKKPLAKSIVCRVNNMFTGIKIN